MTPREALSKSPLFSRLSQQEIEEVAGIVSERTVGPGEILIREGETAYSLFILEEGSVDVLRRGDQGQSRITELGEGSMFGEMAFLGHPPRTAGIVSHGRAKVLELPYEALEKLAIIDPVLGVKLYKTLAVSLNEKLKSTTDHMLPLIASARMAALGQMTANIAHELNNPFHVIRSLSERIAERVAEPHVDVAELRDWAESISQTVKRAGKVIAGLRSVSRDGTNDPSIAIHPSQVIADTLDFSEQTLKIFAIKTDVLLPDSISKIFCRSVQASQVLLNLLNNAMDAVASFPDQNERWIRIEVSENRSKISIAITDAGGGIPEKIADKIFRPFFTTKGVDQGTGLGLSIARQIMESNGGSLILDRSSKNTRFVMEFPRAVE